MRTREGDGSGPIRDCHVRSSPFDPASLSPLHGAAPGLAWGVTKEVEMPSIFDMPWVFAVVFLSVIAVVLTFVLVSLVRRGPTHDKK